MTEHRLQEQLDIRHIAEAHKLLAEAVSAADSDGLTLDASEVSRIDTAGAQLLASALKASPAHVSLHHPAPCVTEAFESLGLATLLNS